MSTGGEGGMITTNNKKLWHSVWALKDMVKVMKPSFFEKKHPDGFRWLHESLGTNARMTEFQAIGRIQLKKLHNWRKLREKEW